MNSYPSTQPLSPPLFALHLPRCPPMCDPTDPTMVCTPHIPPESSPTHTPNSVTSQPSSSHILPHVEPHTSPQTSSTRPGLGFTIREGCSAAPHGYFQAASAWSHPITASNSCYSAGTKLTGPVIPHPWGFLKASYCRFMPHV